MAGGAAHLGLMMMLNLRGVRESGSIFALPTYFFIVSALLLIVVGLFKAFVLHHQSLIGDYAPVKAMEPLSLFLLLRSFATGCSAMTGVEAISNGVPAFQKPETRNASTTLTWMALILGTLFLGITLLATSYHVEASATGNPTVISLIASQVFSGPLIFLFPVFQLATLGILTLSDVLLKPFHCSCVSPFSWRVVGVATLLLHRRSNREVDDVRCDLT